MSTAPPNVSPGDRREGWCCEAFFFFANERGAATTCNEQAPFRRLKEDSKWTSPFPNQDRNSGKCHQSPPIALLRLRPLTNQLHWLILSRFGCAHSPIIKELGTFDFGERGKRRKRKRNRLPPQAKGTHNGAGRWQPKTTPLFSRQKRHPCCEPSWDGEGAPARSIHKVVDLH